MEESRIIMRNMCRGMIAQEPSQVSFLSTVKSMKGCWSGGDDDQYRFRGGTQVGQTPTHNATSAEGPLLLQLPSPSGAGVGVRCVFL